MAAESKDAEKVYKDQQAVKGEKKDIAADTAKLKADREEIAGSGIRGNRTNPAPAGFVIS